MTEFALISWIRLAQAAETELVGREKNERSEIIERIARDRKASVAYVRRALTAYKHVAVEAPRRGLSLVDVRAPISTVETIKRIANLSPGDAEAHYRRALLGETSYSSLLTLHAMLERQARDDEDERKLRLDLDEVARRILTDLADMGPCRRIEPGEMARSFKADLEFESASDAANASAIALVSPSWKPPGDRLAAEDVCANILAGSLAFSRVYYVASAGTDWERVWRTVTRTRADLSLIRPIFLL